ncbi:MAG: hypothetical protein RQ867_09495 [Mariprofundaceae bacterium]|nr:hypothetical protein [Mariprofundaceae bacterium]
MTDWRAILAQDRNLKLLSTSVLLALISIAVQGCSYRHESSFIPVNPSVWCGKAPWAISATKSATSNSGVLYYVVPLWFKGSDKLALKINVDSHIHYSQLSKDSFYIVTKSGRKHRALKIEVEKEPLRYSYFVLFNVTHGAIGDFNLVISDKNALNCSPPSIKYKKHIESSHHREL